MDRRKALGNIGQGIGTVIVTPSIVSIFQRCQSSKTFNPTFFIAEDFNLISRLMEIIIPKTDIPGAIELKLPEFVDNYIDAVWDKKSKENINKSLKLFKDVAKTKFGQKPTRDLTYDELDKLLDKFLKSKDINGYENFVKIYEGRGHQISHAKENYVLEKSNNGVDSSGIFWMSKFTRNSYPKKVVWKQDDVTHDRFYWLKVNEPKAYSLIVAKIESQVITISYATVSEVVIMLHDNLLNMDKEVKVVYMDKEIFKGYVPRTKDVILNSINEYGDPESIYYGKISVSLGN